MIYESAYAKTNLVLDVVAKRPDGYHDLHSCMQTVGLCDTISAEITEGGERTEILLTCSDTALSCDEKNLAYRAADLYLRTVGIDGVRVKMHIDKRIPLSAGLGGGSADAAAVLRLMNRHFKNKLTHDELCELGAKLGADVPFCITGGTCRCEGVGEILTPVETRPDYTVLIAKAGGGVSTPEAFARLDELHGNYAAYTPRDPSRIYAALACGNVQALANCAYNSFEDVILPIYRDAAKIKSFLTAGGAVTALMSGSGPSVFGIFVSDVRAECCAAALRKQGIFAAVCRTVG